MPDIEINVQDYQNVFSASVGSSPLIQVSIDHSFNTVSVEVVNQTPTVNVDIIGTGPQGPAGQDGADGAAAGFGTPTASVDSNVGTPAVTVTASGPDTAKVFDFAFVNLKGDKGDTGSTGATPEIFATATTLPAGSPASANISGTIEQPLVTFGIPKGDKGDTGAGVPVGGTTGQMLQKKSGTDYDTEWVTYTDADTKVEQTYTTTSGYTYWRPVVIGDSGVSTESAVFTTSTAAVKAFTNLRFQPSTGTLKATAFKGDLTGSVTGTASGNLTSSSTLNPANLSGVSTGTTQFLREDGTWATPAYPSVPGAYTSTPSVLGTASAGVSNDYSRGDHVHEMPSASDVGALADDTKYAGSPSVGGPATVSNGIHYAQVDNTSTATAFTATIPGITSYYDGLTILLKNGVVTSASGFTININNLGAKQAYSNMAAATAETTLFNVNYTMLFVYDSTRVAGGGWICYRGYNSDTNTIGYQLRTNSTILKTYDKFRYYKILFTAADGTHWVPAASDTANSATSAKTVNQRAIDPFGRIVYCSATTNYAAEADIAATTIWDQYNLTLGYSFNRTGAALALTVKRPVYIKCAPQTNGSAIIDSSTPFVQTLPSTNDGKIYIFLGVATSATQVEITVNHPVYYHDGTTLRLWTGSKMPAPSSNTPQPLGTAAAGSSADYSRADHVHAKPTYTAADVGAIADPGDAFSDALIRWDGSNWVTASFGQMLSLTGAEIVPLVISGSSAHISLSILALSEKFRSSQKVLFLDTDGSTYANVYEPIRFDLQTGETVLRYIDPSNSGNCSIATLYPTLNDEMDGTIFGYPKIDAPSSPSVGDFLVYTNNGWDAVTMAEWQGGSF